MSAIPTAETVTQPAEALHLFQVESLEEPSEISPGGQAIRDYVKSAGVMVAIVSKNRIEFPDLNLTCLGPLRVENGRD